jgi:hypothetical protein
LILTLWRYASKSYRENILRTLFIFASKAQKMSNDQKKLSGHAFRA